MTPATREKLEQTLIDHGLTVLQTRDHNAILQQLASLAEFKRLVLTAAAGNPIVEYAVSHVIKKQLQTKITQPQSMEQIPEILAMVNRALQSGMIGE